MVKYIIIGAGFAFAAAIQPGPLQAYLFSRVTAMGPRKTLPAAFAPLLSDGPIALAAILILGKLAPGMQAALRVGGGVLLLWLGWKTYVQWKHSGSPIGEKNGRVPNTFFEAALVNLLNPNPYLAWSLILGPTVVAAWREAPLYGMAMIAAFYVVMVSTLSLTIVAFGSARFLGAGAQRGLLLASSIILAGLGLLQFIYVIGLV